MRIRISLSNESIEQAIQKLEDFKDDLEENLHKTISILTNEGAEYAQAAYGNYPVEAVPFVEENHGEITVVGDMPLIAEFGAGDTVINPSVLFENEPDTPVYPGSYSLEEGTKEYATYGSWHFGGQKYTSVEPHLGLFMAKNYIIEHSTEIAQEVFGSD